MALDTYDNLVKEVIKWSHRDDLDLLIPDFISLAESSMYANATQTLSVRSMGTIITALTTGKLIALPDGFEVMRSIRLDTANSTELQFQAPEQMKRRVSTGMPYFYTIIGDQIEFDITPDSQYTVEMQYLKRADPLTAANQTNAILTKYPNTYLFGALMYLFAHAQDTQEEQKYIGRFSGAIQGANKAEKQGKYGPAPSMSYQGRSI